MSGRTIPLDLPPKNENAKGGTHAGQEDQPDPDARKNFRAADPAHRPQGGRRPRRRRGGIIAADLGMLIPGGFDLLYDPRVKDLYNLEDTTQVQFQRGVYRQHIAAATN